MMVSVTDKVNLRCRVCGSDIRPSERKTEKTQDEMRKHIYRAFQINVDNDDVRIPDYVCESCRTPLYRNYKATSAKKKFNLKIEVYDWNAEFNVCEPNRCQELEEHSNFVSKADEIAKRFNLQKWEHPSGDILYIAFQFPTVTVDRCLTLSGKQWRITVRGNDQVPCLHPELEKLPQSIDESHLDILFSVTMGPLCVGNPDYAEKMKDRDTWFGNSDEIRAQREIVGPYLYNGKTYNSTIRRTKCSMLATVNSQCPVCNLYRTDLSTMKDISHDRTLPSSRTKYALMTRNELAQKAKKLQSERRSLQRQVSSLEEQMDSILEREGVSLQDEDGSEIHSLVTECASELDKLLQDNTPQRLLWESQKRALQCKDLRGVRWHPAIIRWCVALHAKSPAAYKALRDSNFITLPHQNTINNYVHYTDLESGLDDAFMERLVTDFDFQNQPPHKRRVTLMFDEMKLKSGLAYNAHSGRISGFTALGTFNDEINEFERRCKGDEPPLASHVFVLMVRGITSSLQKPLAYYPCHGGCSSFELYNIVNEAVEVLEFMGFYVDNLTSDGASANRKLYSMMKDGEDSTINGTTFATDHIVRREDRLYFMSDVPHLIKTTRNCWENSREGGTRNMVYKGLPIQWTHLKQLYNYDIGLETTNPGLRKLHKIHHEHVNLSPSLRMRVYMAAQVLSGTVANAMESMNKAEYKSTILFIRMMNKFFDCMNVSNFKSNKPDLQPYRSPDDPRLQWLTDTFLGFLEDWQHESDEMNLKADEKRRLCLSPQTLAGLRLTVYSFVHLCKHLLKTPGVKAVLSEKFCQDPLEEYFSRQRAAGGGNDNPNVEEFRNNTLAEQVSSDASRIINKSRRGNTFHASSKRPLEDSDILNCKPMPKKQRAKLK